MPTLLEHEQRLSRSLIWRANRRFYEEAGITAWQEGVVPSYVTSNAYLAHAYAQVIARYLVDVRGALAPGQVAHIVELAAGTGRFGYYLLLELERLQAAGLELPPYRLVLTDGIPGNVEFMRRHPGFARFVAAGAADFACFDVERDQVLPAAGPLVVIANYILDSLPPDAFRVDGGDLTELVLTLETERDAEPDPTAPAVLERMQATFTPRPVPAGAPVYGDPFLDGLLDGYRAALSDRAVLIPVGAMACMRNLHALAGGRLLLLAGDKGWRSLDDLRDDDGNDPQITLHGSVSLRVNFHALGACAEALGGQTLLSAGNHGHLAVAAFLFGAGPFTETRLAFAQALVAQSPLDVYELRQLTDDRTPRGLPFVLALLRLASWDPELVCRFAPAIEPLLQGASAADARVLADGLRGVAERIYPIGDGRDIAFIIGRMLYGMGELETARRCFEQSVAQHPRAPEPQVSLGICQHLLGDPVAARACFDAALALAPTLASARSWRARVG